MSSRPLVSLLALAVASFAIGTAEFVIVGLLPEIAADFRVGIPVAGLLVSGYAMGVVVGGPILTVLAHRLSRRLTLVLLMVLFGTGNLLCAVAPSYEVMMAARVVTAFVHAAFFGIAVVVAADLVAPERRARAMALVFAGLTVAHVFGIPAGAALGHAAGWRTTFWAIAALGAVAVAVIVGFVPRDAGKKHGAGVTREFAVLRRPQVLLALAMAMLPGASGTVVYAFITPLLTTTTGVAETAVPWYLLMVGVGGTLGIFAGGRLADWRLMPSLVGIFAGLIGLYLVMLLAANDPVAMLATTFAWGFGLFATGTPLQARAVDAAREAPHLASTLNQSATNLGNALGPALGATGLAFGMRPAALPWIATAIVLVALALGIVSLKLDGRSAAPVGAH